MSFIRNFTPLTKAAIDDDFEEVRRLIEDVGVNVNEVDLKGRTALGIAVRPGLEKMVQYLLGLEEIDVNRKNDVNTPPLMTALHLRRTEIANMLLNRYDIDVNEGG